MGGEIAEKGLFFAGCFLLLPVSEKNRDSKFKMIFYNKKNGFVSSSNSNSRVVWHNILFLYNFLTIFS